MRAAAKARRAFEAEANRRSRGPRIPCGRRVDLRRVSDYEALIAPDAHMYISSFEPVACGYVYGGDVTRCSADNYLKENPRTL